MRPCLGQLYLGFCFSLFFPFRLLYTENTSSPLHFENPLVRQFFRTPSRSSPPTSTVPFKEECPANELVNGYIRLLNPFPDSHHDGPLAGNLLFSFGRLCHMLPTLLLVVTTPF